MSKHPTTTWTLAETEALERDWRDGRTVQEIASALKRTTDSVYAKVKRLPVMAKHFRPRGGSPVANAVKRYDYEGRAWTPNQDLMRDEVYVAACLSNGGFCALSERRLPRNQVVVCLPVIWPHRVAA